MKPQDHYSSHEKVWLLLPWYANGTLEEPEEDLVRKHLRVCLTCRKELAEQQTLHHRLQHVPLVEISPNPSFGRLMSRIHKEGQSHGGSKWWKTWHWRPALPRLAFALAAGLLALSIPWMMTAIQTPTAYHTVADQGSLGQYGNGDLKIVFAGNLAQSEIEKILKPIRGKIVDGPSIRGVYTVRITDELFLARTLEDLRGNKAVILAEPALPPEGGLRRER